LQIPKEVPDTNPTGRKFLLRWLDDPTYLPPIRKPKENAKRGKAKTRADEKVEKLEEELEADVMEWTRNRAREMIQEGADEESIYNKLGNEFSSQREHSNEAWEWHQKAREEVTNEFFWGASGGNTEGPWKPADLVKPSEMQVRHWVLTRLGEIMAADSNFDCPEDDLYSELSQGSCDDKVWAWCEAAIKQLSPRPLSGAESSAPGS
jgi:hypothetical protein